MVHHVIVGPVFWTSSEFGTKVSFEHNRKLKLKNVDVFVRNHRLKHRGPDWSGIYQHGDCFLAHQRLAIIDPASGDQPLFNEDKSVVVTVG